MKVFYFFGLRTRRTDPQWFIWSVLLSAPIAAVRAWLGRPSDRLDGVLVAVLVALVFGVVSVWAWRQVVVIWPALRVMATVGAWDSVFGVPWGQWIQVTTSDGTTYLGWPAYVGQRSDTEDPDIFLRQVAIVNNDRTTLDLGADGLLLSRSRIESIVVFPADEQIGVRPAWLQWIARRWAGLSAMVRPGGA